MRFVRMIQLFALWMMMVESSVAGNVHEHIQYLPSYEDIQKATGGYLGEYKASDLITIDPEKNYLRDLNARFGENLFSENQWKKMIQEETFEGLCQKIANTKRIQKLRISDVFPVNSKTVMRGFFTKEDWHFNPKGSYQAAGTTRNRLFGTLDQNHSILQESIENSLKNGRIWQNNKTVFSVPTKLANKEALHPIGNAYRKLGYQSENFLSIPRNILEKSKPKDFNKILQHISTGIQEQWLDGVDVSGSIREISKRNQTKASNLFKERLQIIFEECSSKNISLRIHAFEETNRGSFYDDFWDVLKNSANKGKLPRTLRVGHIQGLLKDDIHRLATYKNSMNIIFEANLESNLALNRSYTDNLVKNIGMIHQSGMKVALGSDGAGILGVKSNYSMSLSRLMDAGLSEKSIDRLVQEGKNPLPGHQWDPGFEKKLSDQTDEMVDYLKKTSRKSSHGCTGWFTRNVKEIFIRVK